MALPTKENLTKTIKNKMANIDVSDPDTIQDQYASIMAEIMLDLVESMEVQVTAAIGEIAVNTITGLNVIKITIGDSEIS